MILDYRGNPMRTPSLVDALAMDGLTSLSAYFESRFHDLFVTLYDADNRRIDTLVTKGKIGDTIEVKTPRRFRSTDG